MPTKLAAPSMGCTGKAPEHRPRRRHCSVAGRQRHQSPRPPTNRRRRPTRNPPGPVETTPRPGCRACDLRPADARADKATRRTYRTQSKRRQAAPAPTTRTTSQRAIRARPIAHLSRGAQSMRLHSIQWQHRQHTGQSALSNQGPGYAGPAGACPSFAAGHAAVWVSAPRDSGGRRLLN
jgi:hypothetical protein